MQPSQPTLPEQVDDPTEVYHLARNAAFAEGLEMLLMHLPERRVARDGPLHAAYRDLVAAYRKVAEGHWQDFLALRCESGPDRDSADRRGPPELCVDEDARVVLAHWGEDLPADVLQELAVGMEADALPRLESTPFRERVVAELPEGTQIRPLIDPGHSAKAAVAEAWSAIVRDSANAARGSDARLRSRGITRVCGMYHAMVRIALSRGRADEFHGWRPDMPEFVSIMDAAELINRVAATAWAQQVCALYMAAAYMEHRLSLLPLGASIHDIEQMLDQAGDDAAVLADAAAEASAELAARHGLSAEDHYLSVAFQLVPHRPSPVLLAIPRDTARGVVVSIHNRRVV